MQCVRNFASKFFSVQVVPWIDKIDVQLQLIPHKQDRESFNGMDMPLTPMVCNMKSDIMSKKSSASQPFKVKKAVLGTYYWGNLK